MAAPAWELRLGEYDLAWDVASLRDLACHDPASWRSLVRALPRLASLPGAADPSWRSRAEKVVGSYHERGGPLRSAALSALADAWSPRSGTWTRAVENATGVPVDRSPVWVVPSICTLSPRNLPERRLSVPVFVPTPRKVAICAHEVCHFHHVDWLREQGIPVDAADLQRRSAEWAVSEILAALLSEVPAWRELFGASAGGCYACTTELYSRLCRRWRSGCYRPETFRAIYWEAKREVDSGSRCRAKTPAPRT